MSSAVVLLMPSTRPLLASWKAQSANETEPFSTYNPSPLFPVKTQFWKLTGEPSEDGRWMYTHDIIFCGVTFAGSLARVDVVWNSVDIVNAGLVISNLIGIVYLLPEIAEGLRKYQARTQS